MNPARGIKARSDINGKAVGPLLFDADNGYTDGATDRPDMLFPVDSHSSSALALRGPGKGSDNPRIVERRARARLAGNDQPVSETLNGVWHVLLEVTIDFRTKLHYTQAVSWMARQELKTSTSLPGSPPAVQAATVTLDRTSFVPFYRQVADQVRQMIQAGRVAPGEPFLSEGGMARELGISKMTVRQAFQILRTEGLLTVSKGRQPVVAVGRLQKDTQELRGFTEEMTRRGLKPSSKLLEVECLPAKPQVQQALNLESNERVYRIRRLRLANGEPLGIETTYLPALLYPDLARQDLEKNSLYALLETHYGVRLAWSEEELEARPAGKEEARLLRVRRGSPLFCMRRKVCSAEDTPVEYAVSLFRGDRYTATVVSRRKPNRRS
jgi:GntR family transcriptional regulator